MININVKVTKNNVRQIMRNTPTKIQGGIREVANDLARTSSESAPHWSGNLEKSFKITYKFGSKKMYATIRYSAIEDGFDYAIAMHEWTYELGEKSKQKSGGTGMSGTSYPVGRKFLTRVLEGEKDAYQRYLKEVIESNLNG